MEMLWSVESAVHIGHTNCCFKLGGASFEGPVIKRPRGYEAELR